MSSRVEKYSKNATNTSRQARNRQLYDDLYSDTSYSNSVVLDESKEIDLNKIKEILEKEKKYKEKKTYNPTNDLYADLEDLSKTTDINRVYDINEVLKSAKSSRDILEDANEKRKIKSNYASHIDIQKELDKAKNAYVDLKHEETELLELMNTLTNATKEDLAMDIFSDLTENAIKKEHTIEIQQIEDDTDNKDKSQEYNSSTFMFDTKDFDREMVSDEYDDLKKSNTLAKTLIIIFVILFIAATIFFIKNYILK
ncbi:MAG: hypothetical protein IKE10_01200 [Bacilli bacterium]|nr:hypothetical protein [Bacilli bacterium]